MIVQVGNNQVAGPTIEWEVVAEAEAEAEVILSFRGYPKRLKRILFFFLGKMGKRSKRKMLREERRKENRQMKEQRSFRTLGVTRKDYSIFCFFLFE